MKEAFVEDSSALVQRDFNKGKAHRMKPEKSCLL